MSGRVYLVGAGPGDPGLLTRRGERCLAAADVVVHDYLVGPRLLELVRGDAEVIELGGLHDEPRRPGQDEIERLLVARARAGKTVVRLKNGDPFLFGRGAEEAEALARAGVAAAETETDTVWLQAWTREDLAAVLQRAGRVDEAREELEKALAHWERKRCVPCAERIRARIDLLGERNRATADPLPEV